MERRVIKIKDGPEEVNFIVNNCQLNFAAVKNYFPDADAIVYKENGISFAVDIMDGMVKIVDNKNEYEIFKFKKGQADVCGAYKKRKVDDIIMQILNKTSVDKNDSKKKTNKKEDASDCNKLGITRKVFIGWKHKYVDFSKFQQIKEPIGGIKILALDTSIKYSIHDIKDKAISVMKTNQNETYFDSKKSIIQLGNFQDEIFTKFTNFKGEECDFWGFCNQIKNKNRQLRLYLLTSDKIDSNLSISISGYPDTDVLKIGKKATLNSELLPKPLLMQKKASSYKKKKSAISVLKSLENQLVEIDVILGEQHNVENVTECHLSELSVNKQDINEFHTISSIRKGMDNPLAKLKLSIPIIHYKQISFSSEPALGKGAFGLVRKASWLGTVVAIKSIKRTEKLKYIQREIQVMDAIRHPNVIFSMAVAVDEKYIHIVMEYFDSNTLREIIFNDEIKEQYYLQEKNKHAVALQIFQAIAFLHERKPAVIHKDIKLENTLVNKCSVTKICDLGLSRFKEMLDELVTTFGRNFHGTPIYMAPEILIHNKPSTEKSDMWSLACVIIELYNESCVWTLGKGIFGMIEKLKKLIESKAKPDLSKIPISLQPIVALCFEYDPIKRPKATTLLDILKYINDSSA